MLVIVPASRDGVDIPMLNIEHETKGGSMADGRTFLGLDKKRICRWDMRTREGAVQDLTTPGVVEWKTGKDYSSESFTCMKARGMLSFREGVGEAALLAWATKRQCSLMATSRQSCCL